MQLVRMKAQSLLLLEDLPLSKPAGNGELNASGFPTMILRCGLF